VRTVGSIARYRAWKSGSVGAARDFVDANNAAVRTLVAASTPESIRNSWSACRDLGLDLGRKIGSEADLDVPPGLDPQTFVKALGAGNETGLAIDFDRSFPVTLPGDLVPLVPSREGLRWE
jgi:hypothetical protein